jgi:hypothetical protein
VNSIAAVVKESTAHRSRRIAAGARAVDRRKHKTRDADCFVFTTIACSVRPALPVVRCAVPFFFVAVVAFVFS